MPSSISNSDPANKHPLYPAAVMDQLQAEHNGEAQPTAGRGFYGKTLLFILLGMALAMGLVRAFALANDASSDTILGRVMEAKAALPQIVEEISQMKSNRYKGRDRLLVVWVRMILDTIGKYSPRIQSNVSQTLVLSPTKAPANLAQVDWVFDDLGVDSHELRMTMEQIGLDSGNMQNASFGKATTILTSGCKTATGRLNSASNGTLQN